MNIHVKLNKTSTNVQIPTKGSTTIYIIINIYLSHCIIDSFPRILKWKMQRLIPVLLDTNDQRLGQYNSKLVLIFMIFSLIFVENCLQYDAIHGFSVWLRTDSNPAVSKRHWNEYYNPSLIEQ